MAAIEDAQRENVKERVWDEEKELKAKVQNVTEQIIQKIKALPQDELRTIIEKYGKKNVASFLAVSALGKSGFKRNLIITKNGLDEQETEEENPHTECQEEKIEATERTTRATQEERGLER